MWSGHNLQVSSLPTLSLRTRSFLQQLPSFPCGPLNFLPFDTYVPAFYHKSSPHSFQELLSNCRLLAWPMWACRRFDFLALPSCFQERKSPVSAAGARQHHLEMCNLPPCFPARPLHRKKYTVNWKQIKLLQQLPEEVPEVLPSFITEPSSPSAAVFLEAMRASAWPKGMCDSSLLTHILSSFSFP